MILQLHVLPREVLGQSTFALSMRLLKWFPVRLVDQFLLLCSWLILGDICQMGITRPEIGPLELKNTSGKTPVLDVGTIAKIKSGHIKVSANFSIYMLSSSTQLTKSEVIENLNKVSK